MRSEEMNVIKKIGYLPIVVMLILSLSGCGSSTPASSSGNKESPKELVTNAKYQQLAGDPDKYKGYPVELTGKVFGDVEAKDGVTAFQMWADPKDNNGNIIVYSKSSIIPKDGDFVKTKGIVKGKFEGKNGFGAAITAITLNVETLEIINAVDILAPAKQKADINKTITQNGFSITMQKIEFADTESRVYLQLKNDSKGKVNLYKYSIKATQNGKQFEPSSNYDIDYPEVQTELLPGVASEGIITLEPLDGTSKSAQFYFEGSFADYNIRFEPMKFDITW
jgi:hypothetical protein